jgi:cytoskeletal protein RodZ
MTFTIRDFNKELTLGEKIKTLRKRANITISDLEYRTKIHKDILRAFESGTYDKLPEPIYARNFVKIIAGVLQANESYFLDLYESERGTCDFVDSARLPRQREHSSKFLVASRIVKFVLIGCAILALTFYLGSQIRSIIKAPILVVYAPVDGLSTRDATIAVSGQSETSARVSINGLPVLLSRDGLFEQKIVLKRGVNVLTIESNKRYSKTASVYRRLYLEHE